MQPKPFKIKNKTIGIGYPTLLIAEMACAHQGEKSQALELVNVAAEAKADAVQLQIFKKEIYMCPLYKDYNLIQKLEINQSEWSEIIDQIKKQKLLLFGAGYDIESIEFLIKNDVDAFKIHSSDTSNPEILK